MDLGGQLKNLSDDIMSLFEKSTDVDEQKKLRKQMKMVLELNRKLVAANVTQATTEYQQAIDALNKANAAIKEALADLEKTAQTITKIAKAVDKVGELATKFA